VFLKGDNIFKGYLNEDKSAFKAGWFGTGDIVIRDDDGFFHCQGRKNNIIISGGLNIQPEEINNIIREYRGVRDIFTFGLEDETFGQIVASLIESSQLSTADEKRIIEHCRSKLSEYKVPRNICFTQELPRGASGKIILRKAKDLFSQLQTENRPFYKNEDLGEVVISIAEKVFCAKNLDLNSGNQNVEGWDSLGHLNFILALEEVLDIRIPPAEIFSIQSIGDAVKIAMQRDNH